MLEALAVQVPEDWAEPVGGGREKETHTHAPRTHLPGIRCAMSRKGAFC